MIKDFIKKNWQVILVLSIFITIKLGFIFSRYHLPIWDEGVYVGIGKYIYSLGTSGLWEIIRPVGLPLVSGLFWALGLNEVVFTQLFILVMASGNIFLAYLISKKLFNKTTGIIAATLLAITPVFFLYTTYILTEIPSTFFALLAIYLFIEKKYFYSGIFSAAALMFRFPHGLIIPVILISILFEYDFNKIIKNSKDIIKKCSNYIFGTLILIMPFLIFNYIMYRKYTGTITDALFRPFILAVSHQNNIFEGVAGNDLISHLYNIFYYLIMIVRNNIVLIFAILGIILIIKNWKKKNLRVILISPIIYILYHSYIINKQERFLILFLPIICILAALGLSNIYEYRTKNIFRHIVFSVTITLFIITGLYALNTNYDYYYWQYETKPEITYNYYEKFDDSALQGPILISDPVIAAYTDKLLIEYRYENREIIPANEWENIKDVKTVNHFFNAVPCLVDDTDCVMKRRELFDYFNKNYILIYNSTFYDNEHYIFKAKQ